MDKFIWRCMGIVLLAASMAGCVAAVVAGAAAGMVYDRRSVSTLEADARLFHVIHTAIVTKPQFRDSRVLVTSFNKVILLVGQVSSQGLRAEAEQIARSTSGVYRIYNELTVGYPIAMSQRTKDSWITSQVRSQMLARKGLESGSIRVVTENGIIYLMGIVTPEQANLAVDVARRIDGVVKVVKMFQYIR
ncbi:MAG: BON domain-containing protein [Legionella sp.]|nr:MAG: BON domain-containing protein [Legionella sp.]PJD97122.1 MAG: BON domain-containing protein [Legionella sp.]